MLNVSCDEPGGKMIEFVLPKMFWNCTMSRTDLQLCSSWIDLTISKKNGSYGLRRPCCERNIKRPQIYQVPS